jgi:hypothetical protein
VGASGTTTVNFGAFPGASDAHVDITGQASIVAGSLVEAWIRPVDTADHLHDEHLVETIRVIAGSIVAATGFTIYAFNTSQVQEPVDDQPVMYAGRGQGTGVHAGPGKQDPNSQRSRGGTGTRIYGLWTVAWVWS